MGDLKSFCGETEVSIEYEKIELSNLSQMINIMRSKLGTKPLSQSIKDPKLLVYTLNEMAKL